MARKRMIDPNIWQSEDFSKLSTLSKLVFIGLFSLADDEGKGRCNPVYLRSTLFPYDEGIRSTDIDKTLSEISSNMSILFYSCNGSNYYRLTNWNIWQKIDRPSDSKIPNYDENSMNLLFDDNSTNVRRAVVPNKNRIRIEDNIKENKENINKKKFGEFQNVLLSDDELKKLSGRYPEQYKSKIEEMSCYIKNYPNKYKDHYATLLNWLRKDKSEKEKKEMDKGNRPF